MAGRHAAQRHWRPHTPLRMGIAPWAPCQHTGSLAGGTHCGDCGRMIYSGPPTQRGATWWEAAGLLAAWALTIGLTVAAVLAA